MSRTKRVAELESQIEQEVEALLEDFSIFTTGTRYLSLLHRTKDGGENKEHRRRGGFYITHTPEEYRDALARLLTLQAVSSKPYRLYASVNSRDIKKAEKHFKADMLEMDFSGNDGKRFFYERFESKWASALMAPSARDSSMFLIDADGGDEVIASVLKWLAEKEIEIVKQYKTPNGWHVITAPFNPMAFDCPGAEIKKDGLLLLSS